jgi:hypothetical protein
MSEHISPNCSFFKNQNWTNSEYKPLHYQKDYQALPGNLQNRKIFVSITLPPNFLSLSSVFKTNAVGETSSVKPTGPAFTEFPSTSPIILIITTS